MNVRWPWHIPQANRRTHVETTVRTTYCQFRVFQECNVHVFGDAGGFIRWGINWKRAQKANASVSLLSFGLESAGGEVVGKVAHGRGEYGMPVPSDNPSSSGIWTENKVS